MVETEDLNHFKHDVLNFNKERYGSAAHVIIAWEFSSGKVIQLHPFVETYDSVEDIPNPDRHTICLQKCWRGEDTDGNYIYDYEPWENMRPKK